MKFFTLYIKVREVFERLESRMKIAGTDVGRQLQEQIDDLMDLLCAFRSGEIVEDHKE